MVYFAQQNGKEADMGNWAYMLRCADGSFYSGWSTDPARREREHGAGRGAKYTRSRGPCTIAYLEECGSKNEAMSREWHIKKLTHREREMLANGK